jgi:hypothetical protein
MDGTAKLGLMTATVILGLWAVSWILAEIIIYLTKDE